MASSGDHIMISYQWDSQKRMKKLKDRLEKAGFEVWMDVDNIAGNLDEAMAQAVDGASVVLACFSEKYQESDNCKKELQYADFKKKRIIPLKCDGHKPTGWLGILIGKLLYYDVTNDQALDETFDKILRDIERDPGLQDQLSNLDIRDITRDAGLLRRNLDDIFLYFLNIAENEIERARDGADSKDKALEDAAVFRNWRQTVGKKATRQEIIVALRRGGYRDAAAILKDKWEKN